MLACYRHCKYNNYHKQSIQLLMTKTKKVCFMYFFLKFRYKVQHLKVEILYNIYKSWKLYCTKFHPYILTLLCKQYIFPVSSWFGLVTLQRKKNKNKNKKHSIFEIRSVADFIFQYNIQYLFMGDMNQKIYTLPKVQMAGKTFQQLIFESLWHNFDV